MKYDLKKRIFCSKAFTNLEVLSPDLKPADFYLWGYLKTVVYNPMPKTLKNLIAKNKREINKTPENVLKNVENFEKRCHLVVTAESGNFE